MANRFPSPRTILITGASSGIGEALAHHYAQSGCTLFLSGRNAGRLESVAAECRHLGAHAVGETLNVADRDAMTDWIGRMNAEAPLDLVIANAGISAGSSGQGETPEQAHEIFAVNLDGVLNTIHPAMAAMRRRGSGQVALMSSMAAYLPLSGAPAYAAAKVAVRNYGLALRPDAAASGIGVSVICPGFVRSRITDRNTFPMPFLMDAARAARIIETGLAQNKALIAFPWQMRCLMASMGTLPSSLMLWLSGRLPRKASNG